jgi:hypothetical protein
MENEKMKVICTKGHYKTGLNGKRRMTRNVMYEVKKSVAYYSSTIRYEITFDEVTCYNLFINRISQLNKIHPVTYTYTENQFVKYFTTDIKQIRKAKLLRITKER